MGASQGARNTYKLVPKSCYKRPTIGKALVHALKERNIIPPALNKKVGCLNKPLQHFLMSILARGHFLKCLSPERRGYNYHSQDFLLNTGGVLYCMEQIYNFKKCTLNKNFRILTTGRLARRPKRPAGRLARRPAFFRTCSTVLLTERRLL